MSVSGIGGQVKVYGKIELEVKIECGVVVKQSFVVVERLANELLLGADFIKKNELVIDVAQKKLLKKARVGDKVEVQASQYKEVRLVETVDLKPQFSTVVAYDLDEQWKDKSEVFAIGIFPDKNVLNDEIMIQSQVIASDCNTFLMPIINCSEEAIQLKAGTIIAYAERLVTNKEGHLVENGMEWCPKEVNCQVNKEESLMEKFRMHEANLTEEQQERVRLLLEAFDGCISKSDDDVGLTSTVSHKIELTKDTAIKQPIRRVTGPLAEQIEDILKKDHADGIIRPSNSPWSSCIVPVKKRCGGLRLAIDYRLLNRLTVKDSFPLPNLTDAVYNLHGSAYFSTLDLTRGYYNVPMDEDSIPLTAFSTNRSHWEF
ncbi:unnamed protein product, partial [Rotaria magnacalcarata]